MLPFFFSFSKRLCKGCGERRLNRDNCPILLFLSVFVSSLVLSDFYPFTTPTVQYIPVPYLLNFVHGQLLFVSDGMAHLMVSFHLSTVCYQVGSFFSFSLYFRLISISKPPHHVDFAMSQNAMQREVLLFCRLRVSPRSAM